ncbi:septum formation family protein [Nocardiopsis sp. MT53]|uniref:septum formation family protein n=1 Tax=Nocardiopsis TaxID=2013 RepID=UPI001C732415|nr:septum formation family protein [Nocardiopsis sp. MT53]QYX39385.1 septum formation family protein [Nocardiopsis sp. MT53]
MWGLGWTGVAVVAANYEEPTYAATCEPPPGYANACTLEPGDCFMLPSFEEEFPEVELTSCDESHDAQAIGAFTAPAGDWPGMAGFASASETECSPIADRNVDASLMSPSDQLGFIAPNRASWDFGVDHVTCIVFTEDASWTSSVLVPGADLSIPTGY